MSRRKRVPKETETRLLVQSRRRCCLCFGLDGDLAKKRGQIAHLDQDPANDDLDNLAYLCFDHHDEYDSRTKQSKGLTIGEVKGYRDRLYERLEVDATAPAPERTSERADPPRSTEITETVQIGNPLIRLLRGVRLSRVLQIGTPRIEVTDESRSDEEKLTPQ